MNIGPHFINMLRARPDQVARFWEKPVYMPCPCCGGAGFHLDPDSEIEEFLGMTMIPARRCTLCLPWLPGRVYTACMS